MFNPFPGLRPFEPGEDHLFFGREKQVDELLRRLRVCRFLAIVGTSGSGKSSLVRSGLMPALDGGFMARTSSSWRTAIMRPGEDPVRHLAAALNSPTVLEAPGELEATNAVLIEATLRRGTLGLVEAVRQARMPANDNLLVVVDQFEELFRYRRNPKIENSRDEAIAFVKLLLEASQQEEFPIYVVITMRSDFIGDCMDYPGLPEAVNGGQYLVPRMTRDQLRSAVAGPVAVGGGTIAQRLILRLLNDFGDDYDQLPVLQHALMRTWDFWEKKSNPAEPIDIVDYEGIGTVKSALSLHAEEAYEETGSDLEKKIAEKMFKALTDTFSDPRGTRRPTSVADLAAICETPIEGIVRIVEIFRRQGRSFLMPPSDVPLEEFCIIDLSHESLMRCWSRLSAWADQERASAEIYTRLSDAATWFYEGKSGFWRNPELEFGQKWKLEHQPTAAWAERYNPCFAQVMSFLDQSEAEWQRINAEKKRESRKKLRQTQWAAGILGSLFLIALFLAFYAWRQTRLAEKNLQLAKQAVDESLSSAGREQAREGSDSPQLEQFRKELLDKAASFYTIFARQNTSNSALRAEEARAHSRLGDINRLIGNTKEAVKEYTDAIARFEQLARGYPKEAEFSQALGYCHNWLGETIRQARSDDSASLETGPQQAEKEYNEAIQIQQELLSKYPGNAIYKQELARTYYNRGIIHFDMNRSEAVLLDLSKALELLEPLVALSKTTANGGDSLDPAQDLARVYNNNAIVLERASQYGQAEMYYEKAIRLLEQLVRDIPANREYKAELAQYCDNEARMLADTEKQSLAALRSQRALDLLEDLAAPSQTLLIRRAKSLQLRSQLLEAQKPDEAKALTDEAFAMMKQVVENEPRGGKTIQYSALYMNIGANYLELAQDYLKENNKTGANQALASLTEVMPHLSQDDRATLEAPYKRLQKKLLKQRARP